MIYDSCRQTFDIVNGERPMKLKNILYEIYFVPLCAVLILIEEFDK